MSPDRKDDRKGFGALMLIGAIAVALVAGVAIGYVARGEPEPGAPVTVEDEVPAVTVTVPAEP